MFRSVSVASSSPLPDVGSKQVTLLCVGPTNNPQVIWSSTLDLPRRQAKTASSFRFPASTLLNKTAGRYQLALQVGDGEKHMLPGVLVLADSTLDDSRPASRTASPR